MKERRAALRRLRSVLAFGLRPLVRGGPSIGLFNFSAECFKLHTQLTYHGTWTSSKLALIYKLNYLQFSGRFPWTTCPPRLRLTVSTVRLQSCQGEQVMCRGIGAAHACVTCLIGFEHLAVLSTMVLTLVSAALFEYNGHWKYALWSAAFFSLPLICLCVLKWYAQVPMSFATVELAIATTTRICATFWLANCLPMVVLECVFFKSFPEEVHDLNYAALGMCFLTPVQGVLMRLGDVYDLLDRLRRLPHQDIQGSEARV